MVLAEPGLISLRESAVHAGARHADLVARGDGDIEEILRLIQDRYQRLLIGSEHRPSLGDNALAHLGLPIPVAPDLQFTLRCFPTE